jgi:peptide/nickel transport system permease protein
VSTSAISPALRPGDLRERLTAARRRHPVAAFLVRRGIAAIATLLVASVVIFLATELLPGDPASVVLGRNANAAALQALRARLGLEHSLAYQYVHWLSGVLHGDLGNSATQLAQGATSAPISSLLGSPLINSALLAALTTILMIPLSLLFGVWSGIRAGRAADHAISVASLALASLPEFVVGAILLLVFFDALHLLPPVALVPPGTSPLAHPDALVLPVLTLLMITCGWAIRQIRAGVVEVGEHPYVAMARLNGFSERRVVWRYVVRNALAASVQVVAQNIQYLLGGIIVVESVFAYPGVGKLLVDAVGSRDFREVQAIAMIVAAFYVAVNILADLAVILLVPKLRTGSA